MAYSDYGGYAYKGKEHIISRSDALVSAHNEVLSTPGVYPGFFHNTGSNSYHVLLGDGPAVYVGLRKQRHIDIFNTAFPTESLGLASSYDGEMVEISQNNGETRATRPFDPDTPIKIEYAEHKIEIYWTEEDNFYQYVRLLQPDGVVWRGFSGYGVGMGLEEAGYGYSTPARVTKLFKLFPLE